MGIITYSGLIDRSGCKSFISRLNGSSLYSIYLICLFAKVLESSVGSVYGHVCTGRTSGTGDDQFIVYGDERKWLGFWR